MRPWRKLCEHVQKENICAEVTTTGRGLTKSQDISLYPSVYIGTGDVSSVCGEAVDVREQLRPAGMESNVEGHREGEMDGREEGRNGDDEDRLEGGGRLGRGEVEGTGPEERGEVDGELERDKEGEEGSLSRHSRGVKTPAITTALIQIPQTSNFSTLRNVVSSTNRSEVIGGVEGASGCVPTREDVSTSSSVSDHSSHGKMADLSSLLSSMSIDDSDHMKNASAASNKCVSGGEDPAHLSDVADSTHIPTSSTYTSGPAHLSNGPGSTHLSNIVGSTYDTNSAHLSNGQDSGRPSNVVCSTHLSGHTHFSDAVSAHLSNVTDKGFSRHLSDDTDSTHLSDDSDATHLSGDTGSTHSSKEAGHLDISSSKMAHSSDWPLVREAALKSQRQRQFDNAEGLQGYSDELDSDMTELRLCEVHVSGGKLMEANPGEANSGGKGMDPSHPGSDIVLTHEGKSFQPPSFSTPYRRDAVDRCSGGTMRGEEWGNFARLDSSEFGLPQTGSCRGTQFQSDFMPSSHIPGPTEYNSSCTRLESFWGKVDSPMDVGMSPSARTPCAATTSVTPHAVTPGATPCVVTPYVVLQPSAKKSILKKRRSYSDGGGSPFPSTATARKNLSKSVTFKLPSESCSSEGSLVLAVETPEHLWCTPLSWNRKPSAPIRLLPAPETSYAVSEVTLAPPGKCSSLQHMDVSLNSTSCVSRDDSHMDYSALPPATMEGKHCSCHGNCNHGDACATPAISIHDSEESGAEDMSILAVETPVEFWESIPVNFINNTFNR